MSLERRLSLQTGRLWWLPLLLALALTLLMHAAILSEGFEVSLFEPDGASQYFDASADALLEGRLDVDPYHIGSEAFVIGDRTYGYFGSWPALLRIPLHALFPSLWGHWERLMLLLAAAVTMIGAELLASTALGTRPVTPRGLFVHGLYLSMIGLGSTTLFLASRPNVYDEAIAWGGAMTLLGLGVLALWLRRPSPLKAAWVVLLCFFALHARMLDGLGLTVAVVLVAGLSRWRGARWVEPFAIRAPASQLLVLSLGAASAFGSYTALNTAKFGTLVSVPRERNVQSSAERLARGGDQMSLRNLLPNAYNYLMPWNVRFGAEGAPIQPVPPEELLTTSGMDYDWREPVIGMTIASPCLCCLSMLGLLALIRHRDSRMFAALALGSSASVAALLLYHGITQRYAHDMLPMLAVTAALALPALEQLMASGPVRAWVVLLAVAGTWSVFVWCQLTLQYSALAADLRIEPIRAEIMVPAYERELRLHPNNATLHAELAGIDVQAGRLDAAQAHLARALAIDPGHEAPAHIKQSTEKQIAVLQGALRKSPESVRLRRTLAVLLLAVGRKQEGLDQLRSAIAVDPEDAVTRELLARVLGE